MSHTYKNGYREGVVFAFIKDDKILIECRPTDDGEEEIFFTSGSIENKDYNKDQWYPLEAMYREISEEFQNKVNVKECFYLDELIVDEINVVFYVYLITKWEGNIPEFTIEDGKVHSKVRWIRLEDREKSLKFESALEICKRIIDVNRF